MKVLKPSKLSVLNRCFEHQRRYYMGVSVLAFIPLDEPPRLLPEAAMWAFAGERLGAEGALDVGIPKACGEYLIHGSAYAPGGVAVPELPVGVRVGPLSKQLQVSGDRYWVGRTQPSAAQPFTELPLAWDRAYGGPDFPRNPLGRGRAEVELIGQPAVLLPNVEDPRALIDAADQDVEPAGLRAIDISWPQRSALAGTYDQRWLEELFPGFAADVDWGVHNIAPRDQQREGWWRGGEDWELINLHPDKPRLVGSLPRWQARSFITRAITEGEATREAFEEVPLSLQTLWFFPDAERAVLIFQGSIEIATDDASDVLHLMIGADALAAPRPAAHYAEVLAARLDRDEGVFAALDDAPLVPPGQAEASEPTLDEVMQSREGLLEANLHKWRVREAEAARAFVAAQGLDPDVHGPCMPDPPAPPPDPKDIPALIESAKAQAKAMEAEQLARQAEVEAELDAMKVDGLDAQGLREEQATPTGPPTFSAATQRGALELIAMESRSQGYINDEIEEMLADDELYASWKQGEQTLRGTYLLSAHTQPPAPAMAAEDLEDARVCLRKYLEAGRSVSELNLTGGDFSGMDLRGADLSDTWFESANFSGADLRGAKLDKAVLAHANLRGAKLDGASAREANLGKARLDDASARAIDLESATLVGTHLERTQLSGAKLTKANLNAAKLIAVDASEVQAEGFVLSDAEVRGTRLCGARFERVLFVGVDLRGVDLSGIHIHRGAFINCPASGAKFDDATLDSVAFVEDCPLDGASFVRATMPRCNLRGQKLDGADFSHASLDASDLSSTSLVGAKFYRALAREARFVRADLDGASLLTANLMQAVFTHATITGADLRGANLYAADMARVRSDERVRLDDALLTKVRINPRYHEPAVERDQ
ncbi:DUF2169 domain-containing protein [Pseudenhygromyxa sp. WMMC2535]|uniref:DUF2169 family type VI secretion system accessory protein n=1 Tax=Pseudenhygromyxa sp. WMMC2535 TaxID=2712867 RepID=UPI0015578097|nr:DUF2169 domain-containing protein [Pseudenhygromyxa sp. WMMC2535]NVB36434.1 DUF2169 domain-containing protein [Pseudenhygromyxa sp. WMMC2535]